MDKLYAILNYISIASEVTDNDLDKQSPDYLLSKFEQMIGDVDNFEFPTKEIDYEIISDYQSIWGNYRLDVNYTHIFKSILVFLKRANWESYTLPSEKINLFETYIGDFSNIKSGAKLGDGLHKNLISNFFNLVIEHQDIKADLIKLKRDFDIDKLLYE